MERFDQHGGKRAAMQTSTLFLGSANAIPHSPLNSKFKGFAADNLMQQFSKNGEFKLPGGISRPSDKTPKNYFHALLCGSPISCKALDELKVSGLQGDYFQKELSAIGFAPLRGQDLKHKDPSSGITIILPAATISKAFENMETGKVYWEEHQLALISPGNQNGFSRKNGVYVLHEATIAIIHSPATKPNKHFCGPAPGVPHPEFRIAVEASEKELGKMADCEKRFNELKRGILPVKRSGSYTIDSRTFFSASFSDVCNVLLEGKI